MHNGVMPILALGVVCYVLGNINTLRPRKNGHHFPDNIFKHIFLNENIEISSEISLKFVPHGSFSNNPALVQIMAWRWVGNKLLSTPIMAYSRIYVSLGLNELTHVT